MTRRIETVLVLIALGAMLGLNALLGSLDWVRLASALGIVFLIGLAMLFSSDRRSFPKRAVAVGLLLQLVLGVLILRTPFGRAVFVWVGKGFEKIMDFSREGAQFVFGGLVNDPKTFGFIMAFQALPIIIFMGALTRMLYHLGVLQKIVQAMAFVMRRLMRVSGAESLSAGANVFVGMVEAPLTIRPYVPQMTRSELFCVMTAGMATVAGSVMAVYVSMLKDFIPGAGGHLLTASVMSAPAAILVAKIMIPETERPLTLDAAAVPAREPEDERPVNLIDAAAKGSLEGLRLALNVGAMLIAFIGLVAMANALLGAVSGGHLSLQRLLGFLCSPIALGMGIPPSEALEVGSLIGQKTVVNEWVAYESFKSLMSSPETALSGHTKIMVSYALCGFANFGSVAIMIAGIGGMAPNKRPDLARLGLLSIVSGSIGAFLTACMAGLLAPGG